MLPLQLIVILLVFSIPIILILSTLYLELKKQGSTKQDEDETKIMQEIHQGLSRMNNRIDSLETILYDKKHNE